MISITHIEKQVSEVVQYSQELDRVDVTELISRWQNAKKFFINAWGGEVIKECGEATFELSKEEKNRRLNEFLDAISSTYGGCSYEIVSFIDDVRNEFFTNHLPNGYKDIVPKGTKIIKAFKYFVKDERMLSDLQNQASMILQEDKITGTLCFSVHPLDYLSSSENTYHWRSCHALDGDYRAGNLSYMVDTCTVVCYLRGSNEAKLPHFPDTVLWNNKKWRMLLFANDICMFAGRQYPFSSTTALQLVKRDFLTSIGMTSRYWSNWHDDYITSFHREGDIYSYCEQDLCGRYISMFKAIYRLKDIIKNNSDLHFNDLLESSYYIPYYCWYMGITNPRVDSLLFHIGGEVQCLRCGKHRIKESAGMICEYCWDDIKEDPDYRYCDCCDTRYHIEDLVNVGDSYFCPECIHKYFKTCEKCGELYANSYITYNEELKQYLCDYCQEELNHGTRN